MTAPEREDVEVVVVPSAPDGRVLVTTARGPHGYQSTWTWRGRGWATTWFPTARGAAVLARAAIRRLDGRAAVEENPWTAKAKLVAGVAALTVAAVAAAVAYHLAGSTSTPGPNPSRGPQPPAPGPGGQATQWSLVKPGGQGQAAAYALPAGTYRATAQTSGNVSVKKSDIMSELAKRGLANVTLYGPGEPFPDDWPDGRAGPNLWRVEATSTSPGTVPVASTQSFLFWSGTVTVLSMYALEPASSSPAVEWTVLGDGDRTFVDASPNDVVRVRMPPAGAGESWFVYETGSQPVASIHQEFDDPATLKHVVDLRMLGGCVGTAGSNGCQVIGEMKPHQPNTPEPPQGGQVSMRWTIFANVAYPQA